MTRRRTQVVVALVIACLAGWLFLGTLLKLREAAARSQCENNLQMLCHALQSYTDSDNGRLPLATSRKGGLPPEESLSWMYEVDPFFGSSMNPDLEGREGEPWTSERNLRLARQRRKWVNCPGQIAQSDDGITLSRYVGVLGVGPDSGRSEFNDPRAGAFQFERRVRLQDVKDGTEQTIWVIETALDNGPWIAGGRPTTRFLDDSEQPPLGPSGQFGGLHRGFVNVRCSTAPSERSVFPSIGRSSQRCSQLPAARATTRSRNDHRFASLVMLGSRSCGAVGGAFRLPRKANSAV